MFLYLRIRTKSILWIKSTFHFPAVNVLPLAQSLEERFLKADRMAATGDYKYRSPRLAGVAEIWTFYPKAVKISSLGPFAGKCWRQR
jgi:hypothetical protein